MKKITHSIGDLVGSQGPVSKFGWRKLGDYSGHVQAELAVVDSLISEFGMYILKAGDRNQSHDIEVSGVSWRRSRYDRGGLAPGLYEIKSLWRKNERCVFDRRFKVGVRGESIYGRRDGQIKAFAIAMEQYIESIVDDNISNSFLDPSVKSFRDGTELANQPRPNMDFVESAYDFIDAALSRRHSRSFNEKLPKLAKASLSIPSLAIQANAVLNGVITSIDIKRGFSDIEGIFIVAGPNFTLVTKPEMENMLSFDSTSAEGPKLRFHGKIPGEPLKEVIISESDKRKGKKKK